MRTAAKRTRGFTLLELVVTMGIIGVLAAIAIPQYSAYIARGYRGQARAVMLSMAQTAERVRGETGSYATFAPTATVPDGATGTSIKYNVVGANVGGTSITVTATPANTQTADVCGVFVITDTGQRMVQGSVTSGTVFQNCWGH